MTQAFTFPAIILPAFIVAALFLAVRLARRGDGSPWRYRDFLLSFGVLLAMTFGVVAFLVLPERPNSKEQAARLAPVFEADMLVSRGNLVELWFNDWDHPSERVPVVPGERHVYRFTRVPRNISLVRFDPTDAPDARIVIYSLALKSGDQVVRRFGPHDVKAWTLQNVSAPKEEDGGLAMTASSDDPILLTRADVQVLGTAPVRPSLVWLYYRAALAAMAALVLAVLALMAIRNPAFLAAEFPARCEDVLLNPWCTLAIVLLAATVALLLQNHAAATDIGLEADMKLSSGGIVELWFNDWDHPSEQLHVVPGERHLYRFQKLPHEVHLMRLDPTDIPNTRIVIYGIAIKSRNRVIKQLGPAEMRSWTSRNLTPAQPEDGGLAFTSTNEDPIFLAPLSLQVESGVLQVLSSLLEGPDGSVLPAIPALLLVLLAGVSTRARRLQAVMMALAACVAYPIVLLVLKLDLLAPPPVRSAVGYAAFAGYGKANEHFATLLVMVACVGLGCLFARWAGASVDPAAMPPAARPGAGIWLAHASVFMFFFVYFLPNLLTMSQELSNTVYRQGLWDELNMLTWRYMLNMGLRPLRDFWFPYSGSYIHMLPFPVGAITTVLHVALCQTVFYLAVFKITGRRLGAALVLAGLIFAPIMLADMPSHARYLLGVDVALLYVAVVNVRRLQWKTHLPFAVFVGYVFFYEPTQILYAGAGIAVHTMLAAVGRFQGRHRRERVMASLQVLKQRVVCIGIPMVAGVAAAVLVYASQGMLRGLWDFEASIGDMSNYGAWPSEISQWVMPVYQSTALFLMMFVLASYAVYRWIRLKGREDDLLGAALIVMSATTLMVMQKQVARPHYMMEQLQVFPYTTMLLFGLIAWRERTPAVRVVIAAFLGCILAVAGHRSLVYYVRLQLVGGPHRIADALDLVLNHRPEIEQTNATLYARSRFVGFDMENAVVDFINQEKGRRPGESVYVLGDAAIFYLLLNQPAPYDSNSYNDSPLSEQQRMLDWFRSKRPRFVIWSTDALAFDGVPHMVRLPLIYRYVVEHYGFVRAFGPYHILMELPPDQAPDLGYFRRVLSSCIDLGSIPGRSRSSEYAACNGDTSRCDAVLVVKYRSRPARRKLSVSAGEFQIQFDVKPSEREYVVNLNRLWFWGPLAKGAPPRLTTEDAAATAAMEYRRERGAVLY